MKSEGYSLLQFNLAESSTKSYKGKIAYPLYPYQSVELAVIFVYGEDIQRQVNIWYMPGSVQGQAISIVTFMSLAAIVLCIIRRKFKLRRDGLLSTFIHTLVVFIGGGNLRMQHRFEKWFFGILLFGAFFITSIFTGDLLDCVYRILNQKISTFEELAGMNSPIYISRSLAANSMHVRNILRQA